ncbi:hypothetical protein [Halomicrobium sp. LC1Hm]|uniref:hypothetical protein n=1 Tax=Halomicrobium sp. LC1Hm TaxID=2610902 RepID=UPI0012982688|nr:hypothetical protein [Halomicrobium sp. LC1Hm]QGA83234.1 putative membrane protein [Halomicrobium sp. LC1Hm]
MSAGNEQGIVGGIRIDIKRLHETWMALVYPRQRATDEGVLGKWTPDSQFGLALYRLWSAVGLPVVALTYPLVLLGAFLRFQTRRVDSTATRLGVVGVVVLSVLVWGALIALARYQLDLATGGIVAVAAASLVATVSAALAVLTRRVGGRAVTVFVSYPFGVTAIFLPPVVAALFSPAVADAVIPLSDSLARWLLFNVMDPVGAGDFLRANFEREGAAHAIIWFGISVPLGWLLGLLVTLADLVRPT